MAPKQAMAGTKVAKRGDDKKKSRKDPDAPKRPLSAFMIFSKENRPRIREENPDASFGDLGKLLGAAWRELNDKDKQVYTDKADEDKGRYEREMSTYKPT
ncbi:hypothetical protein BATDEDRAFT_89692 [Batrachochytrium dendrobatidis JAM81]|uniref:HMG box domain-containing protein n=2 Tax=Batrachochytrium dendrobatidis TaxID=109871 RepID=F4P6F8_BATDJ|nr:uncharacterized protein BATDEDRAFT_89692 [Batrachochytrium dendrobatidis JAM81]EGF79601.1 hypothetical protein BATDEDRAFT_89692 [Batrachochytrium dendrobatidis JAM81]KAJ8323079.1 Non-histone chromosomal protein 6 [Batrachochytrium dendrobatidis]KAK5665605.1 Non-histone chromosomal protein 6 [Batrachochytrium dendrobatidis]OAJ42528.1 hypothetical protein BDEG_25980 [Batrachochytrium dendrobatidis JEL423]|eukprot:XP_006680220.1 hypothetical protein BATDEDRAFT_89692 [Batrachochytrium dendrobatidis JAM81]